MPDSKANFKYLSSLEFRVSDESEHAGLWTVEQPEVPRKKNPHRDNMQIPHLKVLRVEPQSPSLWGNSAKHLNTVSPTSNISC